MTAQKYDEELGEAKAFMSPIMRIYGTLLFPCIVS